MSNADGSTYDYKGRVITRHNVRRWTIDGNEASIYRSMAKAKAQIDAETKAQPKPTKKVKAAPAAQTAGSRPAAPVAEAPSARYAVLMSTGTPALGDGSLADVANFLAQRIAQSSISAPLKQFKVQDLTLRPDAEHRRDYATPAVRADKWASEHVTPAMVEEARRELKTASKEIRQRKATKALKTLTQPEVKTPRTKAPPIGERYADEQIVAEAGGKITYGMVRRIREATAHFFVPGAPRGKVAAYKELAAELGLGMETVAKISRGNILEDVG